MNYTKMKTNAKYPITAKIWESAKNRFENDLISGYFAEPAELEIADVEGAAYWFWCVRSHQVRVCANALDTVPTVADPKNLPLLLQRLIRHECAHAKYSCRETPGGTPDLIGLREYLADNNVGMSSWNLSEDCWIESKDRVENSYRYGWRKWCAIGLPEDYTTVAEADRDEEHASSILWDIRIADGHRETIQKYLDEKSLSGGGWKTSQSNASKRVRVYRFYRDLIKAGNSWEVADLTRDFCSAFPEAATPPPSVEQGNWVDVPGVAGANGEAWAELRDTNGAHNRSQQRCAPVKELAAKHPSNFRKAPVNAWAEKCGSSAYEALKKGLKAGTVAGGRTISPTSNLNVKDFLAGKPDCYRQNVVSPVGKGQQVEVVYDLSGSMVGSYHEAGIRLMDALKRLHDEGEIKLRITWVSSKCIIKWAGDDFQASDLRFIYPSGGSPLGQGFASILPDVDKNSLVLGYTDGAVDANGYDKGDYMKAGVRPVGAFVSNDVNRMNSPSMQAIFETYQASGDVESCAKGLGEKLKRIRANQLGA